MRWNKIFDGTKESLANKSRRPLTPHPKSHTQLELNAILSLTKRNSNIGLTELYTKLRVKIAYSRHYASLYRVLVRMGFYLDRKSIKKPYKPKKYHTPELLGEKMQLDTLNTFQESVTQILTMIISVINIQLSMKHLK